jgi:hypothetical protein
MGTVAPGAARLWVSQKDLALHHVILFLVESEQPHLLHWLDDINLGRFITTGLAF